MNILFLVNELLIVCGISNHLYQILCELKNRYPNNNYYIICGGGNGIERFQNLGVHILVNKMIKHQTRSYVNFLRGIRDIHNFVKSKNIDLIHSHHHYPSNMAYYVSKIARVKTLLTAHSILPEVGLLNHYRADHIIAVNDHIQNYLINFRKKKRSEVSLIRHGFPSVYFTKKNNKRYQVIAGGRFVSGKKYETYIKAVSCLPNIIKNDVDFYLAGEGKHESYLKSMNTNLNAKIKFMGRVDNFQNKLFETDIFVFTSEKEGFPTSLIEAGIAKNLIISSKFSGYNSILTNKNSLLFEPNDYKKLNKYLVDSLTDFNKYHSLVDEYNETVITLFDRNKNIEMLLKLYRKIIFN